MNIDSDTYIAVLIEQRNQAMNAAATLQARLIIVEREVLDLRKQLEGLTPKAE